LTPPGVKNVRSRDYKRLNNHQFAPARNFGQGGERFLSNNVPTQKKEEGNRIFPKRLGHLTAGKKPEQNTSRRSFLFLPRFLCLPRPGPEHNFPLDTPPTGPLTYSTGYPTSFPVSPNHPHVDPDKLSHTFAALCDTPPPARHRARLADGRGCVGHRNSPRAVRHEGPAGDFQAPESDWRERAGMADRQGPGGRALMAGPRALAGRTVLLKEKGAAEMAGRNNAGSGEQSFARLSNSSWVKIASKGANHEAQHSLNRRIR